MWCRSCEQDVPGVVTSDASRVCCPRCSSTLPSGAAATLASEGGSPAASIDIRHTALNDEIRQEDRVPPSLGLNDWQSGDDAQTVRRVLQTLGQRTVRSDSVPPRGRSQAAAQPHFFAPADAPAPNAASEHGETVDRPAAELPAAVGSSSRLSWSLMAVGLTTLVCGTILLTWCFYDGRESLQRVGLPLALGGQIALLSGLILQLEALGQSNRGAAATLQKLDEQVQELRRTATFTRGSAAPSPCPEVDQQASPNELLADLKSQLDVLAVNMARQPSDLAQ